MPAIGADVGRRAVPSGAAALLRGELWTLRNLVTSRDGRRLLLQTVVVLGFFVLMAAGLVERYVAMPEVVAALRGPERAAALRVLFGLGTAIVLVLVFLDAVQSGRRNLFDGAVPELLLAAPVTRTAIVLRTWCRMLCLNLLWACTFTAPLVALLAGQARLGASVVPAVLLAHTTTVAPVLAVGLALQVLLMRFLGSPRVQRAVTFASAAAALAVFVGLALGMLGPRDAGRSAVTGMLEQGGGGGLVAALVEGPAAVFCALTIGVFDAPALTTAALALLIGAIALAVAARFYPVAFENDRLAAARPGARRRTGATFRWPAGVAASVCRKDLVQIVRQPATLLGLLAITAFLTFAPDLLRVERLLDPSTALAARPHALQRALAVPDAVRHTAALLTVYAWALVMLMPGTVLGLFNGERAQWSLLATSPAGRARFLLGKLCPVLAFLGYYAVVVAVVGVVRFGAAWTGFALCAVPIACLALGVATGVASLPALARPSSSEARGTQPISGVRAMLTSVAIAITVGALLGFGIVAYGEVEAAYQRGAGPLRAVPTDLLPWVVLGALWLLAAALGGAGFALAVRNLERLTEPAAE